MTQNADTSTLPAVTLATTSVQVIADVIDHLLTTLGKAPVAFHWGRHEGISFQADSVENRVAYRDALHLDGGKVFGEALVLRQHEGTWQGHRISVFGPEED